MPRRKQRTNSNGPALHGNLEAVRADLDALQRDVLNLVTHARGAATHEMRGAVDDAVGRFEAWSSENLATVRNAVRSQPLKACVLSIGAGALLGALLLR